MEILSFLPKGSNEIHILCIYILADFRGTPHRLLTIWLADAASILSADEIGLELAIDPPPPPPQGEFCTL